MTIVNIISVTKIQMIMILLRIAFHLQTLGRELRKKKSEFIIFNFINSLFPMY